MRYLQKYESHEYIVYVCRKYAINSYKINGDDSIDTDEGVFLSYKNLIKLPLNFNNVNGYFYCSENALISLAGCPESVSLEFFCRENELSSLDGCPKYVGNGFSCARNYLTSLMWCPKYVGGYFNCDFNKIETFEGLDFIHIGNYFSCVGNPIYYIWDLFRDHTKFEFFNDCDIIRDNKVIILDRLNFFLDYINKPTATEVEGYKCI